MLSLFILIKYISIICEREILYSTTPNTSLEAKWIVTNEIPTLIMPWVALKYSWCCLLTDAGNHVLPRCLLNLIQRLFFGRFLPTKKVGRNYSLSAESILFQMLPFELNSYDFSCWSWQAPRERGRGPEFDSQPVTTNLRIRLLPFVVFTSDGFGVGVVITSAELMI